MPKRRNLDPKGNVEKTVGRKGDHGYQPERAIEKHKVSRTLALVGRNVRFQPAKFSCMIWKDPRINVNCLVFSTGKMVLNGGASVAEASVFLTLGLVVCLLKKHCSNACIFLYLSTF